MKFFGSSPPLSASVGAEPIVKIVDDSYRWKKPHGPPTTKGGPLTRFSPAGVAWTTFIGPPMLAPDGGVAILGGIDADNTGWLIGLLGTSRVNWGESPGIIDKAAQIFITYAPKILAAVVAAAAPGIGTLFAGALIAWQNLATGQSLSDALINASRTSFASPSSIPAFNQGLDAVKNGLDEIQIANLSHSLLGAAFDPNVQKAFVNAVTIGRAKQVQDLTISMLRPKFNDGQWNVVQTALDNGGKLYDALYAVGDTAALSMLSDTSLTATTFVQQKVSKPKDIAAATSDPSSFGLVASTPAPSSNNGGSSSGLSSLVTGGILIGAGYFLYKKYKHQW